MRTDTGFKAVCGNTPINKVIMVWYSSWQPHAHPVFLSTILACLQWGHTITRNNIRTNIVNRWSYRQHANTRNVQIFVKYRYLYWRKLRNLGKSLFKILYLERTIVLSYAITLKFWNNLKFVTTFAQTNLMCKVAI